MQIRRWGIYLVDLDPRHGTKPGKKRPCLSVQPDHFSVLPSTLILPFTTKLASGIEEFWPLRVRIPAGTAGLLKTSDLLVDQIFAWDNSSFIEELGQLPEALQRDVSSALKEFLDLA